MPSAPPNPKPLRVSVIIPVRNGAQFIGQAIDSILSQTLTDLELLVVDDASTDNTPEIIQSYGDPRLRCLRNPQCLGVSASRNRAMAEARAPYVAFLDADDIAYPQRLEMQVAYLENNPSVALVGSHLDYIDAKGQQLYSEQPGQRPCAPQALRLELLHRACILPSTAMGRTSALREVGGFSKLDYAEDHDLWCRLAVKHDLAVMPDRLVAYRQHPNQATFKKISIAYHATQACIGRTKALFLEAGIISGDEIPPPLGLWGKLRGARGSLGAAYAQWAGLHSWALREPRHAISLSSMALWASPLNIMAWRILLRSMVELALPATLFRALRWYGTKLRDTLGGKQSD